MSVQASKLWETLRGSLWFLPSILVAIAAASAFLLIQLEESVGDEALSWLPLLFGAGPDGARGMLSSIASSVLTLSGVTFSITIVALSLAANTYSPRILRNFMDDRGNQVVLGVLLGTFVYSLLVLRTIRSGETTFVPSLAVTGSLVLILIDIGLLIYFIHHIAQSIQVSTITAEIASDTIAATDRVFPQKDESDRTEAQNEEDEIPDGLIVAAPQSGYIQYIAMDKLLDIATRNDLMIRLEHGAGDFLAKSSPLATVTPEANLHKEAERDIHKSVAVGKQRTMHQDVLFGIRQLVDVALKALSPGINDVTTALNCINHLGAILLTVAARTMPPRYCYDAGGHLRLITKSPTYRRIVEIAFDQIRRSGSSYPEVQVRLLEVLEDIGRRVEARNRRCVLLEQAKRISQTADRCIEDEAGREQVNHQLRRLAQLLSDVGVVDIIPAQRSPYKS